MEGPSSAPFRPDTAPASSSSAPGLRLANAQVSRKQIDMGVSVFPAYVLCVCVRFVLFVWGGGASSVVNLAVDSAGGGGGGPAK